MASFDFNSILPSWLGGGKPPPSALPVAQRQQAAQALAAGPSPAKQGWVPSPVNAMQNSIQKGTPGAPRPGKTRLAGAEQAPAPAPTPGAAAGAAGAKTAMKGGDKKGMSDDTKKALLATGLGALGGIGETVASALLQKEYDPADYKSAYGGSGPGSFGANAGVPGGLYRDRQQVQTDRPSLAMALLGQRKG